MTTRKYVDLTANADWFGYATKGAAKAALKRNWPHLLSTDSLIMQNDERFGFWVDHITQAPTEGPLEEDE